MKGRISEVLAAKVVVLTGVALVLLASSPVGAHHGYSMYHMDKQVTMKGTVVRYSMSNPHSQFTIDTKDAKGVVTRYQIETGATVRGMRAGGFTSTTLSSGDEITITFNPSVNGTHIGCLVSVVAPDGKTYPQRNNT